MEKVEIVVADNGDHIEFFWEGVYHYFPKEHLDDSCKRIILSPHAEFAYISDYFIDDSESWITGIEITWRKR